MGRRKIIVYIATSADGYIARPDGDVEWLTHGRSPGEYGMKAFYRSIDTILWGRKTYDAVLGFQHVGIEGSAFDLNVKNYVFSRKPGGRPPLGVTFVRERVAEFAARLRKSPGKNIWMMGGGELIASFLDEDQIDEFIIHVIPVLIGDGIPLIKPRERELQLTLKSLRRFADGVVRLHYQVKRGGT